MGRGSSSQLVLPAELAPEPGVGGGGGNGKSLSSGASHPVTVRGQSVHEGLVGHLARPTPEVLDDASIDLLPFGGPHKTTARPRREGLWERWEGPP